MPSTKASLALPVIVLSGLAGVFYIVIIGLASHFYHELVEDGQLNGANRASLYLLTWSLPGALIGAAAVFEAYRYLIWQPDARHSTAAINLLAALFSLLPFGWGCQQVHYQHTSSQWSVLAAFWIVVPWFQWIAAILLFSDSIYDDALEFHARTSGKGHKATTQPEQAQYPPLQSDKP